MLLFPQLIYTLFDSQRANQLMAQKKIIAGVASMSWINPVTGLPETDKGGDPGETVSDNDIIGAKKYRFSNFLEAEVTVQDDSRILDARFTTRSGMYRGPSFLHMNSAPVGQIGRKMSNKGSEVTFRQLVGCRTESPEKIGAGAGAAVGAAGGGIAIAVLAGPVGWIGIGVAAVAIGAVGYFTGGEIAELASAFPPIWTELELTVSVDGSVKAKLVSHSLFPSNTFYVMAPAKADASVPNSYRRSQPSYDGDATALKRWNGAMWGKDAQNGQGWGACTADRSGPTVGNPWGMENPGPVLGKPPLPRQVPSGY